MSAELSRDWLADMCREQVDRIVQLCTELHGRDVELTALRKENARLRLAAELNRDTVIQIQRSSHCECGLQRVDGICGACDT